ncbi:hypothetical protein PM082_009380 [Marasmius tenuissimus]|nr:hypothetical protein PM082_009380 [Marasmius tenuissimus]
MMDGVVDQIQDGQTHGIWAWDGELDEPVLLLPAVLALLGDNPMQSEFACHIGLRGKLFCRACKVKGKDSKAAHANGEKSDTETSSAESSADEEGNDSESESESDDSDDSDDSSVGSKGGKKKKKRKKFVESLEAMKRRVFDFIKPGEPRIKDETVKQLGDHFQMAQTLGTITKMKAERTRTGLKDTYQMFFVNRLVNSYKGRRTLHTKTTALNHAKSTLPKETMSPVWRIRGLNPHSDTPVEILHVVLLGFVKYLWRDVIQNQIKKKDVKMAELSARLSSANIEGLGLPSFLAGDTLTKYYGSLTGGDFRKLAQVAPFVLHGLVSKECYETWIVLSKLIPLIWQPEIVDLPQYLETLEAEIQNFLVHAAKWSIRWFNKPKFHILVHLPAHIRRFGPAILFATESFESYNAVIRCKSTHSNRQAPSRDIAFAFAQGNRLRHLLSGGKVLLRGAVHWTRELDDAKAKFDNPDLPQSQRVTDVQLYFKHCTVNRNDWVTVGPRPREVVKYSQEPVGRYLGLTSKCGEEGHCEFDGDSRYLPFSRTRSCHHSCRLPLLQERERLDDEVKNLRVVRRIRLDNGDKVGTGTYVIVKLPPGSSSTAERQRSTLSVANVMEVLYHRDGWESVLVRIFAAGPEVSLHGMPRLRPVEPEVCMALNRAHKCKVQQTAIIRQERHETGLRRGKVTHQGNPSDIVLNTAQMRDAKYVQRFRVSPAALPVTETIEASAIRECATLQKVAQTAALVGVQPGDPSPEPLFPPQQPSDPLQPSNHQESPLQPPDQRPPNSPQPSGSQSQTQPPPLRKPRARKPRKDSQPQTQSLQQQPHQQLRPQPRPRKRRTQKGSPLTPTPLDLPGQRSTQTSSSLPTPTSQPTDSLVRPLDGPSLTPEDPDIAQNRLADGPIHPDPPWGHALPAQRPPRQPSRLRHPI